MKKVTIIIPTMWYHLDLLKSMVIEYQRCDLVSQVLIVNNREAGKIDLSGDKVKIIGNGVNQFVNPSWNLGVKESLTEKVILANDDIWIKDVCNVIGKYSTLLLSGKVIGLAPESFYFNGNKVACDRVTGISYGFGVFMGVHKESYVVIPDEFKIWYGDAIQWRKNKAVTVKHAIYTRMAGTSSKLNLSQERKNERMAWQKYISNE